MDAVITSNAERVFTEVRNSVIQGKGIFSIKPIPKGTRLYEYAGKKVHKTELMEDAIKGLTSLRYVMDLDGEYSVDAERGGNDSRFINHSCSPNCEVYFFGGIPYLYTSKIIETGEELSYNYHLGADGIENLTQEQKESYFPCNCGSENCKKTLITD